MLIIASSDLSKKLAVGLSSLVLDLMVGTGALMKTREDALRLSTGICEIAENKKLNVSVATKDMNLLLG